MNDISFLFSIIKQRLKMYNSHLFITYLFILFINNVKLNYNPISLPAKTIALKSSQMWKKCSVYNK